MPIFGLFQGISAKSGLTEPFSTEWCKIDSLTWGVERPGQSIAVHEISRSIAQIQQIHLTKATDGASSYLFAKAIAGNAVGTVTLAITESGSNKAIVAFKLDAAFVTSARVFADGSSGPREELALAFNKIALAVWLSSGIQLCTWDLAAQRPWPDAAQAFTADARWGVRVKA
jgi:type VI protein secretion system component Hcp